MDRTSPPSLWTELTVPTSAAEPALPPAPESHTAAGLMDTTAALQRWGICEGAQEKGKISWKIPHSPLYSCLSGPRTDIFNWWLVWQQLWAEQHGACSWLTTTLSAVARYSPRTQPAHWTGYSSRESTREWRESMGEAVHQQKETTSRFRCPLGASPSAPENKNCGKTGKKIVQICPVSRAVSINAHWPCMYSSPLPILVGTSQQELPCGDRGVGRH